MRFAKVDTQYYCGIDLHSRSMYISVMERAGELLFVRNMPNVFNIFKHYVARFLPEMAVGVESSCYYYWLADACKEADIDSPPAISSPTKGLSGG